MENKKINKKIGIAVIVIVVLGSIFGGIIYYKNRPIDPKKRFESLFHMKVPKALETEQHHYLDEEQKMWWFNFSTETFDAFEKEIKANSNWKELPLPKELDQLVYGENVTNDDMITRIERSRYTQGYWCAINRNGEGENFKGKNIKFSIAFLDTNVKSLTLYERDE